MSNWKKITRWDNGEVIYEDETVESRTELIEGAVRKKIDLSYADLSNNDLYGLTIEDAKLQYASFDLADLTYANISKCDLSHAFFTRCEINYAKFDNCDLNNSKIIVSNLQSAELINSNLNDASIIECSMAKANISNTKMDRTCMIFVDTSFASIDSKKIDQNNFTAHHFKSRC